MNLRIKQTSLAAAIALALTGCIGGGGTDIAGIGGSGFVSSGTITGFGSVYVNGVKYETNSSSFDVEGDTGATQSNLSVGMVVKVYGAINADGTTGTATSIVFDDELQGPVASLSNPTVDTTTFTVLGVTVLAERTTTNYYDVTFDTLADNQNIEISGFYDASGNLHASRIALKTESEVEIKGTITGLVGTDFTIKGINIDASSALLEDLPNGLEEGSLVEVEGSYNSGTNTITAISVESEEFELEDSSEFEVEGFITDYIDNSNFKINGISVNASYASFSPSSTVLANDIQIEAEGIIVDGVLLAEEISQRGGEIEVEALITAIDLGARTFELTPVLGQSSITIQVGNETEYEDEFTTLDSDTIRLENLSLNMFVDIDGYKQQGNSIFATKVTITGDSTTNEGVSINGPIEALDETADSVTLLGVTFWQDSNTTYDGFSGWPDLESAYSNDPTLSIEVKDGDQSTLADGTADSISTD